MGLENGIVNLTTVCRRHWGSRHCRANRYIPGICERIIDDGVTVHSQTPGHLAGAIPLHDFPLTQPATCTTQPAHSNDGAAWTFRRSRTGAWRHGLGYPGPDGSSQGLQVRASSTAFRAHYIARRSTPQEYLTRHRNRTDPIAQITTFRHQRFFHRQRAPPIPIAVHDPGMWRVGPSAPSTVKARLPALPCRRLLRRRQPSASPVIVWTSVAQRVENILTVRRATVVLPRNASTFRLCCGTRCFDTAFAREGISHHLEAMATGLRSWPPMSEGTATVEEA